MDKKQNYLKAKKRAEAKLGFYSHLAIYIGVSLLLVAINLLTDPEPLWFVWPVVGWGIAVLMHGLGVFYFAGKTTDLKEKMIEKELENLD